MGGLNDNLSVFEDWDMQASRIVNVLGLPPDPTNPLVPGLSEATSWYPDPVPKISSVTQEVWAGISSFSESAYNGTKQVLKGAYADIKEGVGTVVGDVTEPISESLKTTFWYALLAVGALGAVIYYAGKSGALRITR